MYNKRYGHAEWVSDVKFLPDGRLVSAGVDNKLCLWAAKGATCVDLVGHTASVSVVDVSSSGRLVVSGSYDRTVRVWSSSGGELVKFAGGHSGPVLCMTMLPGYVVSGGRDSLVMLWDLASGKLSRKITGHKGHVTSCEWFPGGSGGASAAGAASGVLVATGAQDGHVRIWDMRAKGCVANLPSHASTMGSGAVGAIQSTAMAPSVRGALGSDLLVSMGADKAIVTTDVRTLKQVHRIEHHKEFIFSLYLAGPLAFSGDAAGMVMVHDLSDDGRLLYGLGANRGAVRCLGGSPTGDTLVTAGDDGCALVFQFE